MPDDPLSGMTRSPAFTSARPPFDRLLIGSRLIPVDTVPNVECGLYGRFSTYASNRAGDGPSMPGSLYGLPAMPRRRPTISTMVSAMMPMPVMMGFIIIAAAERAGCENDQNGPDGGFHHTYLPSACQTGKAWHDSMVAAMISPGHPAPVTLSDKEKRYAGLGCQRLEM